MIDAARHSGPLTSEQAEGVLALAEAATQADGVAALSEATLLHVRHDRAADGDHVDLIAGDGEVQGYAHLDVPRDKEPGYSGELVVHPKARRRGLGRALLDEMLRAAGDSGSLRVWAHGDLPAAAALAHSAGLVRVRALWQMRRPLAEPVPEPELPPDVRLRTFVPGEDEAAWLEVNARAFAHHPEQGAWTERDLSMREQEEWFDPAGFFLAEVDGRLAGFHWTKVHSVHPGSVYPGSSAAEPIGEVYVVGVDPGVQGGGLGRALTLAGIGYLRDRGLREVMLYVDEDNAAAIKMYSSLGFSRANTDVMYSPAGD